MSVARSGSAARPPTPAAPNASTSTGSTVKAPARSGGASPAISTGASMHLGKFIEDPKGYCANAHHAALGIWPATHAAMEKKAGRSTVETTQRADAKKKPYGNVTYADPQERQVPARHRGPHPCRLGVHQHAEERGDVPAQRRHPLRGQGPDPGGHETHRSRRGRRPPAAARPGWSRCSPASGNWKTSASSPAPRATAPAASSRRTPPCSTSPPRSTTSTATTTRKTTPARSTGPSTTPPGGPGPRSGASTTTA